jgi:hypothetical protein
MKTLRNYIAIFILFATAVISSNTLVSVKAEDSQQFYENNYAARPEIRGTPIEGSERTSKNDLTPIPNTNSVIGVTPTSRSEPSTPTRHRKILALLYVNSLVPEHFESSVKEALRLYDDRQALVYSIYHLGNYQAVSSELTAELNKRHISIEQVSNLPEQLDGLKSPTWILKTRQGVHLVDGFTSLKSLIDEWGEIKITRRDSQEKAKEMATREALQ